MVKIAAITMVKNEADIIESFVRHTLQIVDVLLVTDQHSTDGTVEILQNLRAEGLSIGIQNFSGEGHAQAEVMTGMLQQAIGEQQADIIVPLDADEFLLSDQGDSAAVRERLLSMDPASAAHLVWVQYRLADSEEAQTEYLLSRPCLREAEAEAMGKIVLGRRAVEQYHLRLIQGSHYAAMPDVKGDGGQLLAGCALTGIHLAHFRYRSQQQMMSKSFCLWLSNLAKYSRYSFYTRDEGNMYEAYQSGEVPELPGLKNPQPALLEWYQGECTLRYTKPTVNALANVMRQAASLADSYCRERILARQKLVSVLLFFDGNMSALQASLDSLLAQTYGCWELCVMDMSSPGMSVPIKERIQQIAAGHSVIFAVGAAAAQFLAHAHGDYIQWLLPGDVLAAEKIADMVVFLEGHDRFQWVFSDVDVSSSSVAAGLFVPPYLSFSSRYPAEFFLDLEGFQPLLRQGALLPGSISTCLFRRAHMENREWLQQDFIGARPLQLAMWLDVLQGTIALAWLNEPLVRLPQEKWTADRYILLQMEWLYLLKKYQGSPMLSVDASAEAHQLWQAVRQKLHMEQQLQREASPDLYEEYMKA